MILNIERVSKHFGGIKALSNCNIHILEGKITAIIGPNGSGKSTLFNVISRLIEEDCGLIYFNGKSITSLRDFEIARKGISRTFQEVRLFKNLTIRDHIEIALATNDEGLLRNFLRKSANNLLQIKGILKRIHLNKPLETCVTDLSYGQRKLLDLAVALAKPHSLLMLDEPVAGVNPKLREVIKQIIRDLNNRGETILLIEHDMNFVMDLADHVVVMDEGKVLVEGKAKEIQNSKKVLEAYLGD